MHGSYTSCNTSLLLQFQDNTTSLQRLFSFGANSPSGKDIHESFGATTCKFLLLKCLFFHFPFVYLRDWWELADLTAGEQGCCKNSKAWGLLSLSKQKSKSFPRPMAHRAAPISVSIALGHASAKAVKATAGGWSTGGSAYLTSPLLSHLSSARREGSEYHFKVFGMTRPGLKPTTFRLWGRRSNHWAITPVLSL